ncbi:MAG: DUF1194 domain-containing protein [Paracoccaceae bacterium]
MILRTLACLASISAASVAAAQCRQALALGLDVSGSVDAREYRLQLDGLGAALGSDPVRQALLALPKAPVDLLVYEWSGPGDVHLILPWTSVTSDLDLNEVIATLRATERRETSPGTALGSAMRLGYEYLKERSACWKLTLDLSGDGKSNLGPRPQEVKEILQDTGITINALVIGADAPSIGDLRQAEIAELTSYFRANVILGKDAFVEAALGFEDYPEAMARKLEKELNTVVISGQSR